MNMEEMTTIKRHLRVLPRAFECIYFLSCNIYLNYKNCHLNIWIVYTYF